jgi:succinyl-diaminopimelate desuccinylase
VSDNPRLDLSLGAARLAAALVDIPSESRHEGPLADAVEASLREVPWLRVERHGNTVVAMTDLDRPERVLVGGHLDTVPEHGNLPHRLQGGLLFGLGACDMKGGVAVALSLAASVAEPVRDVTYVFYECEEVEADLNGLSMLAERHPQLLAADLAILMEPSNAGIEAGCQGTLRVEVTALGERAHSARSWLGSNAIHTAGEIIDRLRSYQPRQPIVDGLQYREGLNAVGVVGGVAGNVIPDRCVVTVNYRFAPDRDLETALDHVREVFTGFDVAVTDAAPGALPGLARPAAAEFVAAVGTEPRPKFGWTDVARFSALGVPALNFGPGDPSLAHTRDEHVPIEQIESCESRMRDWLTGSPSSVD